MSKAECSRAEKAENDENEALCDYCEPGVTTEDVPFVDILQGKVYPWFMEGVYSLQQQDRFYPKRSHAEDRLLADIHRQHPPLIFSYLIEDGMGGEVVTPYDILSYESAGLWADEDEEVCLVVYASFDDGETNMLLLYKSSMVDSIHGIKEECQWCVKSDAGNGPRKGKPK